MPRPKVPADREKKFPLNAVTYLSEEDESIFYKALYEWSRENHRAPQVSAFLRSMIFEFINNRKTNDSK